MDLIDIKAQIEPQFSDRFASQSDLDNFCQIIADNIVNSDGYINLSLEDVVYALEKVEIADVDTKVGSPDDISDMLEVINASLCQKHPSHKVASIILQIQFEKGSGFTVDKLEGLTKFISTLPENTDMMWGVGFDNTLGNKVRLTMIVGFK